MTPNEEAKDAVRLLIAAGVPEGKIDNDTIIIALVVQRAIAEAFAKQIAQVATDMVLATPEVPEGAIDYQSVKCVCGYVELRFNQVPLTSCPKCGRALEDEWPNEIG